MMKLFNGLILNILFFYSYDKIDLIGSHMIVMVGLRKGDLLQIIKEIWWSSLMVKFKIFYFFISYDKCT